MKKIALLFLMGLLLCTAAFADHPGKIGLGGVLGNGYSNNHGYDFYPGLSLKVGSIPLFWGFYGHFLPRHGFGLGVTGDYYLFEWNLVDNVATNEDGSYHVKIDWYLGLGFFGNMHFWSDRVAFDAGGRIPFGVSWHAMENLEVATGIAPGVGIYIGHNGGRFHFVFPFEIAVRYWW